MDIFEEFDNITNSTFEYEITAEDTTYYLVLEIMLGILSIFGICLNFAIIYTIFRYKKLHTVANIFIANWSIVDIIILITLRSNFRIMELLFSAKFPLWLINVLYNSEYNFRVTYMLFVFSVMIDWLFASYFSRASQKFRKYYKFTIVFIWALNLMLLLLSSLLHFHIPRYTYVIGYLGFWAFIISLHLFTGVQKCRKKSSEYPNLMLKLTTFLMVCWVPLWITMTTLTHMMYKYGWILIECCYLATSVVTFTVLYRADKDFQACFRQAMKCSRNSYTDDITEFQRFPENVNYENESIQPHVHQNGHTDH